MKRISGIFLKGLAAILPIGLTLYLLYWIGVSAENLLGGMLRNILPERWYVPGLGVVAGLALVFLLGLLLNAYLVQRIWDSVEALVQRIPLVKTVYGAIQDLMKFFSPSAQKELNQVVLVPVGDTGYRLVGFVTRQDLTAEGLGDADTIAVYAPFSYQIGGYTLLVPRSAVTPVNMTVEQAMRFAITAGVSTGKAPPLPGGDAASPLPAAGNAPGGAL